MTEKAEIKPLPEMASIAFNSSYFFHFRYFNHYFTKTILNNVPNLCNFKEAQQEGVKSVVKAQLIFNAILYCEDLALALMAFMKSPKDHLKTLTSVHETGNGSVYEFYDKLKDRDANYFYELIGCTKYSLSEEETRQSINKIPTLKRDMLFLAEFFKTFYEFSTAYKHGFLIYPGKLHDTGESVLGELSWDNLMNFVVVDRIPYNIDAVVYIIYSIFSTVVDALIINLILEPEEQQKENFTKKYRLIEDEKLNGVPVKVDLISYRIHTAKKKLPIYISPIGMKIPT